MPPSLLLAMARVSGSDKLEKSIISFRIKWIMAMAQWLTLLECHHIQLNYYNKIWNYDCPHCQSTSKLVSNPLMYQSIRKIGFWSYTFTSVLWNIWLSYIGLLTSALSAALQCMHACHFCRKPQFTSPGSKQCYLGKSFYSSATSPGHDRGTD